MPTTRPIGCGLRSCEFMLRMYQTRKREPSILNGTSRPRRRVREGTLANTLSAASYSRRDSVAVLQQEHGFATEIAWGICTAWSGRHRCRDMTATRANWVTNGRADWTAGTVKVTL
jgi:hypothetical protein